MWRPKLWLGILFILLATPMLTSAASPAPDATPLTEIHYTVQQQDENGRDLSRQDWVDHVPLMIIMIIVIILINVVLLRLVLPKNGAEQEA